MGDVEIIDPRTQPTLTNFFHAETTRDSPTVMYMQTSRRKDKNWRSENSRDFIFIMDLIDANFDNSTDVADSNLDARPSPSSMTQPPFKVYRADEGSEKRRLDNADIANIDNSTAHNTHARASVFFHDDSDTIQSS